MPSLATGTPPDDTLDAHQIAQRHLIVRDLPTPDFFEGMLLGNGDVGVCATLRPDALGLHLGKSDSWDIRVSEDYDKCVLTFKELLLGRGLTLLKQSTMVPDAQPGICKTCHKDRTAAP